MPILFRSSVQSNICLWYGLKSFQMRDILSEDFSIRNIRNISHLKLFQMRDILSEDFSIRNIRNISHLKLFQMRNIA